MHYFCKLKSSSTEIYSIAWTPLVLILIVVVNTPSPRTNYKETRVSSVVEVIRHGHNGGMILGQGDMLDLGGMRQKLYETTFSDDAFEYVGMVLNNRDDGTGWVMLDVNGRKRKARFSTLMENEAQGV